MDFQLAGPLFLVITQASLLSRLAQENVPYEPPYGLFQLKYLYGIVSTVPM